MRIEVRLSRSTGLYTLLVGLLTSHSINKVHGEYLDEVCITRNWPVSLTRSDSPTSSDDAQPAWYTYTHFNTLESTRLREEGVLYCNTARRIVYERPHDMSQEQTTIQQQLTCRQSEVRRQIERNVQVDRRIFEYQIPDEIQEAVSETLNV